MPPSSQRQSLLFISQLMQNHPSLIELSKSAKSVNRLSKVITVTITIKQTQVVTFHKVRTREKITYSFRLIQDETPNSCIDGACRRFMKVLSFSVSHPNSSGRSGCYGSPHPRTTMGVTERHQLRGPIQESVLDLAEALVWTVDWLFLFFWSTPVSHFSFHNLPYQHLHWASTVTWTQFEWTISPTLAFLAYLGWDFFDETGGMVLIMSMQHRKCWVF
jgi:hypothetical protein